MDTSTAVNLDTLPTVDTASEPAVVLSKKQIRAICKFASNDDARANLKQVRFHGGRMFASDGHRLTLVGPELTRETCKAASDGFGIDPDHLIAVSKSMKNGDTLTLTASERVITRKDGSSADVGSLLPDVDPDIKFPSIAQVVPWSQISGASKQSDRACPGVQAHYLADLALLPLLAGSAEHGIYAVRVIVSGELDPIVFISVSVDTTADTNAISILMPIRL